LDGDDGMPVECVVSLDNLGEAWKALLTEHVTTLSPDRMRQVCRALSVAAGC
jgi:mRNA-degrading endonuclease toxin of MazEF toxin-antitoxin module